MGRGGKEKNGIGGEVWRRMEGREEWGVVKEKNGRGMEERRRRTGEGT